MANIKSAKKRILTTQKKTERNKAVKTEVKTYVKKVDKAIASGNKEDATKALKDAQTKLSKASSKGVLHKNTAGRKIGRLTKAVNAMK